MFDTIERARTPSPQTPDEVANDRILHPPVDHKAGLEPVAYPSVTLYVGPPSKLQLQGPAFRQHAQNEIRLAEDQTGEVGFEVNSLALPRGYLTKAQTMNLIWGGLGKTLETMSKDVGITLSTTRTHRSTLYVALGTSSMTHAVRKAFDFGIFKPLSSMKYGELTLSSRELDVLDGLSRGGTKADVGKKLYITRSTVNSHTNSLLAKNRLENCANAVMLACLSGQLPSATPR